MDAHHLTFQRRLRLLLAQEFAARGYYLDAESFFHGLTDESLIAEELTLLAKVALAARNRRLAVSRFERLARLRPSNQEAQAGLVAAKELKTSVWQRLCAFSQKRNAQRPQAS